VIGKEFNRLTFEGVFELGTLKNVNGANNYVPDLKTKLIKNNCLLSELISVKNVIELLKSPPDF
jgi:hypothetical protein